VRLLFVADGRSPIALNWIRYFVDQGSQVHMVSTFPCEPGINLASLNVAPVAFSGMTAEKEKGKRKGRAQRQMFWGASMVGVRTTARQWLGPLTLRKASTRLRELIESIQPDLVHAMRIPFEGMLAAQAFDTGKFKDKLPLLVSVWGNDFTLHAPTTPLMRYYTRLTMRQADALHTDCLRDLYLARRWGFRDGHPAVVLPGGGGVQPEIFYPPSERERRARAKTPIVINPRGFRAYVRNDTFFQALPEVLAACPGVHFLCPDMFGEPRAERWIDQLGLQSNVTLLPKQSRSELAALFRKASISVSISEHDGTPNTLLEAMASGCFPIAGDIESLREWIRSGENGCLVPPGDPRALVRAIVDALESPDLRRRAAQVNQQMVAERADYSQVMGQADLFYLDLIRGRPTIEADRVH
jgi:glycosyltransferase involved in cell wall biosynthesis